MAIGLSTGEVSRLCGVGRWVITHLVESGKISEPVRIGGKRIFTDTDVEKIQAILLRKNYGQSRQSDSGRATKTE